jgi:hypothetical protein
MCESIEVSEVLKNLKIHTILPMYKFTFPLSSTWIECSYACS